MSREDLPEQRVAVTVFATVRAIDELDGANVAAYAIRDALRQASNVSGHLIVRHVTGEIPVRWGVVMDTGTAVGRGYLRVRPTSKAFAEGPAMDKETS